MVHAFQKRSKSGIKTPKQEVDLIRKRLKDVLKKIWAAVSGHANGLSLLVAFIALGLSFCSHRESLENRKISYWQTLLNSGSIGKITALEYLNERGFAFAGVVLSARAVRECALKHDCKRAKTTEVRKTGIYLKGVNLFKANLANADLRGANLSNAQLQQANLYNTAMRAARLNGAKLDSAFLADSYLGSVDARDASFRNACLQNVNLEGANLEGADLGGAVLEGAKLSKAKLIKARNISQEQIALACGTKVELPQGFEIKECLKNQTRVANQSGYCAYKNWE